MNIRKRNSSDHDGVPTLHSDLNALLFYSVWAAVVSVLEVASGVGVGSG
jgi:hypothetical protein